MLSIKLLRSCFFVLVFINFFIYPQTKPRISYSSLIINAEQNPDLRIAARELADKLDLPLSIYLQQGIFIEAIGIEDNKPVYSIINNLLNPWENGEVAFAEEVFSRYDLFEARVHYGNGRVTNPMLGYSYQSPGIPSEAITLLMIPDWTADKVMSFNAFNGDLINANFIPSNSPNLQSPKEALLNKNGFITVSDQISDLVQKYDTSGAYLGFFAPSTGVNTAVLDNIRGHNYRANGNLVVCVGSGGNQNSIAEFDLSGNYIGQFISTGAGGLASPFDIIFRTNDLLVTTSTASGVYRYTLSGAPISVMVPGLSFAQQIQELSDTRLAVSEFSGTGSGIRLYDSSGVFIKLLNGITGNRGVYQLGNGNFLTTNGAGVHEIDSASGALIRTLVSGVSAQYVTPFDPSLIIPVELVSFFGQLVNGRVLLNWTTASEKNNLGFEIEKSAGNSNWDKIGFVSGNGTTTIASNYSFEDGNITPGLNSYRLKQLDYDGTFNYSEIINVDVEAPSHFSLEQNYPNPFNPSTKIIWNVPANGWQTIKVFDVLGNEITTLVDEYRQAGKYEIEFGNILNNKSLISGVYFYQLKAGNFTQTKKMLLAK